MTVDKVYNNKIATLCRSMANAVENDVYAASQKENQGLALCVESDDVDKDQLVIYERNSETNEITKRVLGRFEDGNIIDTDGQLAEKIVEYFYTAVQGNAELTKSYVD